MDATIPLDPQQFSHLRVSTIQRSARTTPYLCCVCHQNVVSRAGFRHEVVCRNPACRDVAVSLNWIVQA